MHYKKKNQFYLIDTILNNENNWNVSKPIFTVMYCF